MSTPVLAPSVTPRVSRRPASSPTVLPGAVPPLRPSQLQDWTRRIAAEVRAGQYPFVELDPDHRWHRRLYRDRRVDVWLIAWLPTQGTELHDHGGSSGAFTVVSGALTETVVAGSGTRALRRDVDSTVGFGAGYLHDVANHSSAPAISVHAYSPPLSSMTYYDLTPGGPVIVRSIATDDPEPDLAGGPA